jgi:hypothetical protein
MTSLLRILTLLAILLIYSYVLATIIASSEGKPIRIDNPTSSCGFVLIFSVTGVLCRVALSLA